MKAAKTIAWIGFIAMAIVLAYAFSEGDFTEDGKALLQNPWGIVSLVDLYVGFALFSMWIVFRESSPLRSSLWVVLIMLLGFFAGALYTLIALYNAKGDWPRFLLGNTRVGNTRVIL